MRFLYEPKLLSRPALRRTAFAATVGACLVPSLLGLQETGSLRSFRLRPNPEATSLFRELARSPESSKVRAALAEEYRAKGQVGPAAFYLASLPLLKRKGWVRPMVPGPIWLCPSPTAQDDTEKAATEELLRDGEWGQALLKANAALKASTLDPKKLPDPVGAVSCQMAAMWARVVVHAVGAGESVDWSSREMAVRTLIMAIEDLGITEPVPGYELLSDYFLTVRDTASAYGALAAAREHARKWSDSAWKRDTLENLEQRMEPFRERLGVAKDPVTRTR